MTGAKTGRVGLCDSVECPGVQGGIDPVTGCDALTVRRRDWRNPLGGVHPIRWIELRNAGERGDIRDRLPERFEYSDIMDSLEGRERTAEQLLLCRCGPVEGRAREIARLAVARLAEARHTKLGRTEGAGCHVGWVRRLVIAIPIIRESAIDRRANDCQGEGRWKEIENPGGVCAP